MSTEFLTLFEQFSHHVRRFLYDKARETSEEFRLNKPALNSSGQLINPVEQAAWQSLVHCLSQIAIAEKNYMSLSFLSPKGFFKKESPLRSNYGIISSELQKVSDSLTCCFAESGVAETVVGHLVQQLRKFVDARMDLMTVYEHLSSLGICASSSSKSSTFDGTFCASIESIISKYTGAFTHPLINGLVSNMVSEWDILCHLLKAHAQLIELKFIEPLLHLKHAQAALRLWCHSTPNSETSGNSSSWFAFGSPNKSNLLPVLCLWYNRYYDNLINKLSLYFYDLLNKQTSAQEVRTQMSKVPDSFVQRISAFHRRQDAVFICLIFNVENISHFQWQGYRHPEHKAEVLKGLENYPVVFSFPTGQERPAYLLPSAVMILSEHTAKLSVLDTAVSVYDDTKDISYIICRVEDQLYFLATFRGRRSERESHIVSFIRDLCWDLRGVKVFASLRASKS